MNILTFDIEDWYNCNFYDDNMDWRRHEVRIHFTVDKILSELEFRKQKATFFCLGWLAENHPTVIQRISNAGHHIGCHSYQHQLSYNFSRQEFRRDTERAKKLLEDVSGSEVDAFRAPGFSIVQQNISYLEVLVELGFKYDASVFPAAHDFGGLANFQSDTPCLIETSSGPIKEFPMTKFSFLGKTLVFSGGGYFRLLPYPIIKKLSERSNYLMTYFHPRDFDPDQPVIKSLSIQRRFKSYVGLKSALPKFLKYIDEFAFVSIAEADNDIDWLSTKRIKL